jgi:hypothetical protein
LVGASRHNGLFLVQEFDGGAPPSQKSRMARSRRQHAGQARYPAETLRLPKLATCLEAA